MNRSARLPTYYAEAIHVYIDYTNISFNEFLNYLAQKNIMRYSDSDIDKHAQTQSFVQENEFEWNEILEAENSDDNAKLIKKKYDK